MQPTWYVKRICLKCELQFKCKISFKVDDKLEAVSDNELTDVDNISWNDKNDRHSSKDRQEIDENSKMSGPVLVDLEDIESDEDLPGINFETKSLTSSTNVGGTRSKNGVDKKDDDESTKVIDAENVPFCRHCHLLFLDVDALNSHNKTEPHRLNLSGFKPSNGSFYCIYCWIGHQVTFDSGLLITPQDPPPLTRSTKDYILLSQ